MSAPSKGNDQAVPTRPVHGKQQAAEKYEQHAVISQHRVADATRTRGRSIEEGDGAGKRSRLTRLRKAGPSKTLSAIFARGGLAIQPSC
jgi:hypothetical protein